MVVMRYLVANWKMNPRTAAEARRLARATEKISQSAQGPRVIIAIPTLHIDTVRPILKKTKLAAQDMHWEHLGARTGFISPSMLKSAGVKHVIIGHHERRLHAHESDVEIAKKLVIAIATGLKPILCVGGGPDAKKAKSVATLRSLLKKQLRVLRSLSQKDKKGVLIAYEPVGNIGTGKSASAAHIDETVGYISEQTDLPVLYGGSVSSSNAPVLAKLDTLDGFLVGTASLKPRELQQIASSLQ